MCLDRKHFRNPTKNGNEYSRYELDVPCGQCDQCRMSVQSEWYTRLVLEAHDCWSHGGIVLFPTFTYRDSCLPRLCVDGTFYSGFSKSDIQRFLDTFKHFIRKHQVVEPGFKPVSFRYFIAPEFGDVNDRPHYHSILFIPGDVVSFYPTQKSLLRDLKRSIESAWHYGIVGWSTYCPVSPQLLAMFDPEDVELMRMVVRDDAALRYVSKYSTKDLDFWSNFDMDKIDNWISRDFRHRELWNNFLPRHFQSQGLGRWLVDDIKRRVDAGIDVSNLFLEGIDLKALSSLRKSVVEKTPLPRYVYDKLVYDRVMSPDGLTKLQLVNDFGLKIKELQYNHNADYIFDKVVEKSSFMRLRNLIDNNRVKDLFGDVFDISTVYELSELIRSLLPSKDSIRDFVSFVLYLRGHWFTRSELHELEELPSDVLFDYCRSSYLKSLPCNIYNYNGERFFSRIPDSLERVKSDWLDCDISHYNDFQREYFVRLRKGYEFDRLPLTDSERFRPFFLVDYMFYMVDCCHMQGVINQFVSDYQKKKLLKKQYYYNNFKSA